MILLKTLSLILLLIFGTLGQPGGIISPLIGSGGGDGGDGSDGGDGGDGSDGGDGGEGGDGGSSGEGSRLSSQKWPIKCCGPFKLCPFNLRCKKIKPWGLICVWW